MGLILFEIIFQSEKFNKKASKQELTEVSNLTRFQIQNVKMLQGSYSKTYIYFSVFERTAVLKTAKKKDKDEKLTKWVSMSVSLKINKNSIK